MTERIYTTKHTIILTAIIPALLMAIPLAIFVIAFYASDDEIMARGIINSGLVKELTEVKELNSHINNSPLCLQEGTPKGKKRRRK